MAATTVAASRGKPLGYEPTQAVLKHLKFGKRQEIHRHIPQLRTTNALLPYTIKSVSFSMNSISIDRNHWTFGQRPDTRVPNNGRVVFPRFAPPTLNTGTVTYSGKGEYLHFKTEKTAEECYELLFDTFFKNGTVVKDTVWINGLPTFMQTKETQGFTRIRMMSKLVLGHIETPRIFYDFVRFADFGNLESIQFKAGYRNADCVGTPEFINCPTLKLDVSNLEFGTENKHMNDIYNLKNRHLEYEYHHFKVDQVETLVEKWLSSNREIGTRFTLKMFSPERYEKILEMFDRCRKRFRGVWSKHPGLGQSFHANGVTIPMREGRELVMFGGFESVYRPDTLEMEVMKGGSSVKRAWRRGD
ncbi:hypothetical protein GCK72_007906 [Caenorhabditis remanei]|uniref:F-box associated domain-containing protein n=1 Tax=Caenorhabditis remanei TaxID=31234 RepID=A0A6A5HMQ7_CAERE|nr:hypothetical protein GCK72_007906 [Caenorhabditis remanei]KAF1767946.1 hypothetical protein GCK72_007906 [Caenorhabditis remanei]